MQKIQINKEIRISLSVTSLFDGEFYLLDANTIDLCGYGTTPDEAKKDLLYGIEKRLLRLYLRNTLQEELLPLGWKKDNDSYVWTGPTSGIAIDHTFSIPEIPKLILVAAIGVNSQLGLNGSLPWGKMKEDMKHFKNLTTGNHCIVGRKTWESFGKRLPNRIMHVITRENKQTEKDTYFHECLEDAIATLREENVKLAFIIGGSEIYKLAIPLIDEAHITHIVYEGEADIFFPMKELETRKPKNTEVSKMFEADENNTLPYTFYHAEY